MQFTEHCWTITPAIYKSDDVLVSGALNDFHLRKIWQLARSFKAPHTGYG